MTTAVVLMTHRFDAVILEEFQRINDGLGEADQAFLLSDGSAQAPTAVAAATHVFDFSRISRRAVRVIGNDILRNVHLAWLDFFDAHPDFAAYWFIEYDVVYGGPWRELFDAFRDHSFDLLCTHLRPYADEPQWYWWPYIKAPRLAIPRERLLRGFLPIARLSSSAMVRLRDAVAEGWCGFHEGLLPTLLNVSGLRIGDLGGNGPLVPAGFKNRFYTSVTDSEGSLLDLGTMRYRPPILFPRIRPGRLYHPVKPGPTTFDSGVARPRLACAALARALKTARAQQLLATPTSPEVDADRLLQRYTGLDKRELLEALNWLAAIGLAGLPIAELRRGVLDLTGDSGGAAAEN